VFITFDMNWKELGKMSLAGSCAKSNKKSIALPMDFAQNPNGFHMQQIGVLIELNEGELRQ